MYPLIRLAKEMLKFRGKPLGLFDTHVSQHCCWPWDLDPWRELNNGRTLTLFDLGRVPMCSRIGLNDALMKQGWGMTVAGSTVRYRRRVKIMQAVEMRSRLLGWDHRFFYMEQSMWRDGDALNHVLIRAATTGGKGIVPPSELVAAMGHAGVASPELPPFVHAWIAADAERPWPPMSA
ncbi:acyl-CoA thioesterase [Pararhodobacter sp. CCB-MM2]|uniref:acyl-CoA thioesterase n=1 Tax=Pararhodobacter sp. CCB-MM2 TaxID=1786003 RepID=UPI000831228F|nr:acyl-CoA thioesterase [Pararhodobacter sp. CCB-MM2]